MHLLIQLVVTSHTTDIIMSMDSQRVLTLFVGVVALCYQRRGEGVDSGVPQLPTNIVKVL